MWVAPVQPGSQDPGDGAGIFLHASTAAGLSAMTGTCPGSPFALLLSPDGQVGVVVLSTTATLFGAHLLAEAI
jgi:hypothetical protein